MIIRFVFSHLNVIYLQTKLTMIYEEDGETIWNLPLTKQAILSKVDIIVPETQQEFETLYLN